MRLQLGSLTVGIIAVALAGACQDPPQAGQLIIDVDRVALLAGVSSVSVNATDLRLFYGTPPSVDNNANSVDCTQGVEVGFPSQPLTLDLTQTGRTYVATVNAPPGMLQELWLVIADETVMENGISRPLHPTLHCTHGPGEVIRLTSVAPGGVQVVNNDTTEIAAQFDPNTALDHKDPDNAGGNGSGKQNPDANGDIHGGKWSLAASLPFVLVPPESGTGIVDGEIVVRFKDGTSMSDIQTAIAAESLTVARAWQAKNYYVLKAPNGADERPILQYYAGLGSVSYVSPNTYVGTAHTFDPFFVHQVQWPQVGLEEVCITGTPPACDGTASTTSGWQKTVGTFEPLVAIVDGDFDMTNPDIIPNLFINADEVPQDVMNHVGDHNNDLVVDWRDLDANNDGVLTFADLDAMNAYCAGTHVVNQQVTANCSSFGYQVCATNPCTPQGLVTGAGRADPNRNTCATQPKALNGTWEDGVDGNGSTAGCNGFVDDIVGWNFNCIDPKTKLPFIVDGVTGCNLQRPFPSSTVSPQFLTHGTTVASITGASGANGIDTVGIAWRTRILPVQLEISNQSQSNPPDANIRA